VGGRWRGGVEPRSCKVGNQQCSARGIQFLRHSRRVTHRSGSLRSPETELFQEGPSWQSDRSLESSRHARSAASQPVRRISFVVFGRVYETLSRVAASGTRTVTWSAKRSRSLFGRSCYREQAWGHVPELDEDNEFPAMHAPSRSCRNGTARCASSTARTLSRVAASGTRTVTWSAKRSRSLFGRSCYREQNQSLYWQSDRSLESSRHARSAASQPVRRISFVVFGRREH
jgi:hypothetical protein